VNPDEKKTMNSVTQQMRKRWTIRRIAVITSVGALVLIIGVLATKVFLPISTAQFRDADGKSVPNSIATIQRWRINGIDQSVIIRGRNVLNPVLIWLHGGPGSSETSVLRHFNGSLEDRFTVVYWDQRYAGQSLDPFSPTPETLTIDQYVADLEVLVDRLRTQFHKQQIVLLGHSWGTVLGTLYTERHPEMVSAYVGVGQVVNTPRNEALSYNYVLAQARAKQNVQAIADLQRIGAPPYHGNGIIVERGWLEKFGGSFHSDLSTAKLVMIGATASEANGRDLAAFFLAPDFAKPLTSGEFLAIALNEGHTSFKVPMFFLSGRYDHQSDASLVHSYYEQVTAPRKEFVWFENSAHSPPFEEPEIFNAWIVANILPIAE
jgi:proline iminopeptidase